MDILDIIKKHSLTVRCLPYETISYWTYREGDENKICVDAFGSSSGGVIKKEIVVQDYDLEYFKKTVSKFNTDSPEKRYERFKRIYPNGRKLIKETKNVKNGGWWYVKETNNTSSMVEFNRKYDKFFAPTLEEAIKLYLDSL